MTEMERRRIQVASPLRQVRVAATNIMPGRRVTANDIVYTFFLFDTDVQRHVVPLPLFPLSNFSFFSFSFLLFDTNVQRHVVQLSLFAVFISSIFAFSLSIFSKTSSFVFFCHWWTGEGGHERVRGE